MTGRLHARSKGAKAKPPPRMFSAATGLSRGSAADPPEPKKAAAPEPAVAPEPAKQREPAKLNQDQPPEEAVAADLGEKPGGPKVKVPSLNLPNLKLPNLKLPNLKLPNLKLPNLKLPSLRVPGVGRRRVDRPPRVFRLHDPDSSTQIVAPPNDAADVGQEIAAARVLEPVTPMPDGATEASTAAEPEVPDGSPSSAVKIPPVEPEARPTKTAGPTGTAGPTKTARAWRGPRAGRPWRGRKSAQAGVANRRPAAPARPTSAEAAPGSTSRRLVVPRVGRRKEGKAERATAGAKASRRKLLTFKSKSTPSRKRQKKQRTPATSLERRRRIPVAVAGLFALAVLATSFPLAGLLSQHHQLSAAAAQLQQVQRDNRALAEQQHALNSNEAINQLARGDYQMVSPGQTLYDVLPPSKTGTTTPGAATSGDPGNQPLVAPANAPDLSPQPGLPQPIPSASGPSTGAGTTKGVVSGSASSGAGVTSTPSTFWGRVTATLEFWR